MVVSCIPVAYALSRMRWRGREATFLLVLSTMMLPFQVTIVPLYILFVRFGWIGTMKPLIVPLFFGDAFTIFLLRQFFLTIPAELSDAARVDGANEFQIMTRVIVPLAKPAIAAVALFQFLYSWNDFFAPLLYLGENPKLWTLSLGLSEFRGQFHDPVEPHDGRLGAVHAARDHPVLPRPARVRRGRDADRRQGVARTHRTACSEASSNAG